MSILGETKWREPKGGPMPNVYQNMTDAALDAARAALGI